MDERKLTFSGRKALAIIGSTQSQLYRSKAVEPSSKALRDPDKKLLEAVEDGLTVRDIIKSAGVEFEEGLHCLAWLVRTGFCYSGQTVYKEVESQTDKLALFVDLFSDDTHGIEFWEKEVDQIVRSNSDLKKAATRIAWEGLVPKLSEPLLSPRQVAEYFLNLFVALYDRAEKLYGTKMVLAKRILLDVRP